MASLVASPVAANYADGTTPASPLAGKQGEALAADIHGKYFAAAVRGKVFKFNRTAVTVPVIAATLGSVFSLYNPPGSGVVAEVIHTEVGQVLSTTVVDTLAWYFSNATLTALATFTTLAVANSTLFSGRAGDTPSNGVLAYSAVTHSGTPVRADMVASFGATSDAVVMPAIQKIHEGTLLLPPGIVMSLAMSTAAGTGSGLDLGVCWAEWPYSAAG